MGRKCWRSLIIELGWTRPFPFSVALLGCSRYAMGLVAGQSAAGDSNPGQPGDHVSLGHLCEGSACHSQMRPMHSLLSLPNTASIKSPALTGQSQAGSPKVDCAVHTSPPAQPRALLLIVCPHCRLLFWALGDKGELMAAAGSPQGGQVGVRAALLASGQLLLSVQPLPAVPWKPTNTIHSTVTPRMCAKRPPHAAVTDDRETAT